MDPTDRYRILDRFPPETAAFLRGQPAAARRLILGAGADLPDEDLNVALDGDMEALRVFAMDHSDPALATFDLDLDLANFNLGLKDF